MGEMMDRLQVIEFLAGLNPRLPRTRIVMYADNVLTYAEAAANIEENGVIVAHPRTGAPLENPYLKVRKMAGDSLARLRLNDAGLWERLGVGT